MKNVYLVLAVLGFVVPFYFLLQLPGENAFDLPGLLQPLFANGLLKGITADITISVIVFWVYVFAEANRLQMKNAWLYLLATALVGLSFALPLFLYFREQKLELGRSTTETPKH